MSIHEPPYGSLTKQLVTVWNGLFLDRSGLEVAVKLALLIATWFVHMLFYVLEAWM